MTIALLGSLLLLAVAGLIRAERGRRRLRRHAVRDRLTGLGGRDRLLSRLEVALLRAERRDHTVGVMVVDVDRFRAVNERYGADVGDQLLAALAETLCGCAREEDTFARLGGDRFAVLLEELADPTAAVRVAQRMITALDEPVPVAAHEVAIDISVGIATAVAGGEDGDRDLLGGAEQALRAAKLRGSTYELFRPDMRTESRQRLRFEEELKGVAARDELCIELQPVVALGTGDILGLEALVRWDHPRLGLLPPGSFIPLAEDTGAIHPIGRWVMTEACRALTRLRARNPSAGPMWVSVNVSAQQLWRGHDFVTEVRRVLEDTGVAARDVVVEITEGTLLQTDLPATATTLRGLRELGIRLAVDDFGTGYSGLAYLATLPVSIIKIDRSFVTGLDQPKMPAIVEGVIGIAADIGADIIAEGVETDGHARMLRRLGCPSAQGFWLARPMSEHRVQSLLADGVAPWARSRSDRGHAPALRPGGTVVEASAEAG